MIRLNNSVDWINLTLKWAFIFWQIFLFFDLKFSSFLKFIFIPVQRIRRGILQFYSIFYSLYFLKYYAPIYIYTSSWMNMKDIVNSKPFPSHIYTVRWNYHLSVIRRWFLKMGIEEEWQDLFYLKVVEAQKKIDWWYSSLNEMNEKREKHTGRNERREKKKENESYFVK